jgi:hypothetical protein
MEIHDISLELKKLSGAGILAENTSRACRQAAALLVRLREIILVERDAATAQEQLKLLLAEQGEG